MGPPLNPVCKNPVVPKSCILHKKIPFDQNTVLQNPVSKKILYCHNPVCENPVLPKSCMRKSCITLILYAEILYYLNPVSENPVLPKSCMRNPV